MSNDQILKINKTKIRVKSNQNKQCVKQCGRIYFSTLSNQSFKDPSDFSRDPLEGADPQVGNLCINLSKESEYVFHHQSVHPKMTEKHIQSLINWYVAIQIPASRVIRGKKKKKKKILYIFEVKSLSKKTVPVIILDNTKNTLSVVCIGTFSLVESSSNKNSKEVCM